MGIWFESQKIQFSSAASKLYKSGRKFGAALKKNFLCKFKSI